MLTSGDRFVFKEGKCQFTNARNRELELAGRLSWQRPLARVSHVAAQTLAEQLEKQLDCSIEVVLQATGFDFCFRRAPQQGRLLDPATYAVTVTVLEEYLNRTQPAAEQRIAVDSLETHINKEGADAIQWMLCGLHLVPQSPNLPFSPTLNRHEAVWRPPQKPDRYLPLTRGSDPGAVSSSRPTSRVPTTRKTGT